jgi:hypothetical protein
MKRFMFILLTMSLLVLVVIECENNDDKIIKEEEVDETLLHTEGYIVGFDPCTINEQYRIGYVIISTDFNDTLITYNISDKKYKMPASIICGGKTLYKIPWSYFEGYVSSAYFPESARYEFKVKVAYRKTEQDKLVFNWCTTGINQSDFSRQFEHNQVIIKSASTF